MRNTCLCFFLAAMLSMGLPLTGIAQDTSTQSLPIFQAETWQVPTGTWMIEQVQVPTPAPVSLARVQPSPYFLPEFARKNPSGYSFLCRKELQLENRMPVGVWFEMEPDELQQRQTMSVPRLQFKVPLGRGDRR